MNTGSFIASLGWWAAWPRACAGVPSSRPTTHAGPGRPPCTTEFSGPGIEWAAGSATLNNGCAAVHGHGVAAVAKADAFGLRSCQEVAYLVRPRAASTGEAGGQRGELWMAGRP